MIINCPFCSNKMIESKITYSLRCNCKNKPVKYQDMWRAIYYFNDKNYVITSNRKCTIIYYGEISNTKIDQYFEFPDSIADFKIIANKMLTAIMYQQ